MQGIIIGLTLPFLGTAAGAALVFLMRRDIPPTVQKSLLGFASGIMIAASVWSLLIPSINMNAGMGRLAVLPTAAGFLLGITLLLIIDHATPHLHIGNATPEGPHSRLSRTAMLTLAVTIHNIPEGMAVGVVAAGALQGDIGISATGAMAMSFGIAIQNIPEGAIVSMPILAEGNSRLRSFAAGILSGIVEPIGAVAVILLASFITPLLPVLLSFAAGAMTYVVIEELIPEASEGEHSDASPIGFALGFTLMMILDVAIG